MVFLEVLLSHLPLDNHQTGVDERLFKQLTLKHAHQVFNSDIFTRRPFDDSSVLKNLLLGSESKLRVCLTLLLKS
jgi:putative NIF3 family GTP cyclohydrolase 1 type 2